MGDVESQEKLEKQKLEAEKNMEKMMEARLAKEREAVAVTEKMRKASAKALEKGLSQKEAEKRTAELEKAMKEGMEKFGSDTNQILNSAHEVIIGSNNGSDVSSGSGSGK